jgi:DNA-binding NarL/FixJ family response regulator
MKRARLLLADDHSLILEGLRLVLESEYEIVGAVADGRAVVDVAIAEKPDVIILDITMPVLNGINAARQIRRAVRGAKFVFVTVHASPAYVRYALSAGAMGYVLKTSAREEILVAVRTVLRGQIYITPGLDRAGMSSREPQSNALTVRELEVLMLIAEGLTTKAIASRLAVTDKTVGFHRQNIKRKVGLHTTAELIRHVVEGGLR